MKEIHVSDMKCIHCQEKIEKALRRKGIPATIDLEGKTVSVPEEQAGLAEEAIRQAGYTPSL